MRIKTLLAAGTTMFLVVAAGVGVGLYATFARVSVALESDRAARNVAQAVFDLHILTQDYLLHRQTRSQVQWERKYEALGQLLNQPSIRLTENADEFAVMQVGYRGMGETFARLETIAADTPPGDTADERSVSVAGKQRLAAHLLSASQAMSSSAFRLGVKSQETVEQSVRHATTLISVLVGSVVIVVVATSFMFAGRITRPIERLEAGLQVLGSGDLDHRIGALGTDEIGAIAQSVDDMAEQLKATTVSRDELAKEVERRKQTEVELQSANNELEAFAYSVSHDLRAPLRSMDGFSQAVLDDYGGKLDKVGRNFLERIRSASQRMAQLIDGILQLSRVARAELARSEVDLSGIAEAIAAELRDADSDRGVVFDIAPGVVAHGDARLLRSVLENLIGNAWKFTSKNPQARIEVGVTDHDGAPAYYVRDDGAGFDMAYVDKLFGPFQRLHSTAEFEGTGIGLATVARIVQRHGGRVWAEGNADRGATFYFTLSTEGTTT